MLYDQGTSILGRKILLLATRNAMFIVILGIVYDLFSKHGSAEDVVGGIVVCLVFMLCHWLLLAHFCSLVKRFIAFIYLIFLTTGFFAQGGMSALTCIDFCGLMLIFSAVFNQRERNIFIGVVLFELLALSYVQMYHADLIHNLRAEEHSIVNVIEVIIRFVSLLQIFLTYKNLYDLEQSRLFSAHEKLENAHHQIADYNKNLEEMVDSRTQTIQRLNKKLIEYTYFNSHKTRAPLARVQGLLHIMKAKPAYKEDDDTRHLIDLTYNNSLELDNILRQFSDLLEMEIYKSNEKIEEKQRVLTIDEEDTVLYKRSV